MTSYRILVVDDYPDAARVLCSIIEHVGHECHSATTGKGAIEQARAVNPQIALVDIGLPDISGYEVGRALRKMSNAPLFMAAITGWGEPGDRVQAIAAGFDHHVLKPIDAPIVKRLLQLAEAHLVSAGARDRT